MNIPFFAIVIKTTSILFDTLIYNDSSGITKLL